MNRAIKSFRQKQKSRFFLEYFLSVLWLEWYDRTGNEYWNKTDVVTISSILCLYFVSILFRKLKYIVGEMVETERDYVKALDYIIQVIINYLRQTV